MSFSFQTQNEGFRFHIRFYRRYRKCIRSIPCFSVSMSEKQPFGIWSTLHSFPLYNNFTRLTLLSKLITKTDHLVQLTFRFLCHFVISGLHIDPHNSLSIDNTSLAKSITVNWLIFLSFTLAHCTHTMKSTCKSIIIKCCKDKTIHDQKIKLGSNILFLNDWKTQVLWSIL